MATTATTMPDSSSLSATTTTTNTTTTSTKSTYFQLSKDDPTFVHPVSDFPPLSFFERQTQHHALVVPASRTATLRNSLQSILLQIPRVKNVYPANDDNNHNNSSSSSTTTTTTTKSAFRKLVLKNNDDSLWQDPLLQDVLRQDDISKSSFSLTVGYDTLTAEQVLSMLLPLEEIPSAFEAVGPVAHVNLRDEALPFQHIIGKVLMDKNSPRIQTVVNKVGTVDTVYRTFSMKVIAGNDKEGWSQVSVKEEGAVFSLDFQKVYWNSRLSQEHHWLVRRIQRNPGNGVVADLMAGVGPFAVPLTMSSNNSSTGNGKGGGKKKTKKKQTKMIKGNVMDDNNNNNSTATTTTTTTTTTNQAVQLQVHANDLNPTSYDYLKINAKQNKCIGLHCYNQDGRAFVHYLQDNGPIDFSHAIMNLPASAPEFLDAFRGFRNATLPTIHVYCFVSKDNDYAQEAKDRCGKALGTPLPDDTVVKIVRNVAPTKNMVCVSFRLPEEARKLERIRLVEVHEKDDDDDDETKDTTQPDTKRIRLDS